MYVLRMGNAGTETYQNNIILRGSQWARDVRKSVQAYMKGPYETVGRRERE